MCSPSETALSALALAGTALAGSIKDVEQVVLSMQENRAFDHCYGTMAGVRGLQDPNVQINDGTHVWYQIVNSGLSNAMDTLLPRYLNYQGGDWIEATQCKEARSNSMCS